MAPAPSLDDLVATVDDRTPGGDVLAQLGAAAELAAEVGATADALLNHYVEAARGAGASWTQIGAALGVTKQGAQQRFVGRSATGVEPTYLNRFTARARTCFAAAIKEARHLDHSYVGTEHLLLGLLHEPTALAAKALAALGHDPAAVRAAVERQLSPGEPLSSDPVFTPRARRALDLTLGEAVGLGHNYVGTEHLLLGLLREEGGVAAKTLTDLGVTYERVKPVLVEMLYSAR